MKRTDIKNRSEILWYVIIVLYTAFLFSLSFIRIFENNFWGDEAFSIQLSQMPFAEMFAVIAADVHPPLYYIILGIMCRIFGWHGWVYHLTSILPFAATLIFSLVVCIPVYFRTYRTEKNNDIRCAESVSSIQNEINDGDTIYTDNEHFAWTVFGYYFPGVDCRNTNISDIYPERNKIPSSPGKISWMNPR